MKRGNFCILPRPKWRRRRNRNRCFQPPALLFYMQKKGWENMRGSAAENRLGTHLSAYFACYISYFTRNLLKTGGRTEECSLARSREWFIAVAKSGEKKTKRSVRARAVYHYILHTGAKNNASRVFRRRINCFAKREPRSTRSFC